MGGIFGVASKDTCTMDLFFGVDYHSHLGTRRGGMAVYGEDGFNRSIHNIENSPFRTKFDRDLDEASDVFQTMNPSRFLYSHIWAALPSQRWVKSITWKSLWTSPTKTDVPTSWK